VYESINALLQTQRIAALQDKYTQQIKAALKRREAEEASASGRTFIGSFVSVTAAAMFVIFFLFCRISLLPRLDGDAAPKREAGITDATRAAAFLYRAVSGERAETPAPLKNAGLLTNRDL
jgi:hypothetical protein